MNRYLFNMEWCDEVERVANVLIDNTTQRQEGKKVLAGRCKKKVTVLSTQLLIYPTNLCSNLFFKGEWKRWDTWERSKAAADVAFTSWKGSNKWIKHTATYTFPHMLTRAQPWLYVCLVCGMSRMLTLRCSINGSLKDPSRSLFLQTVFEVKVTGPF